MPWRYLADLSFELSVEIERDILPRTRDTGREVATQNLRAFKILERKWLTFWKEVTLEWTDVERGIGCRAVSIAGSWQVGEGEIGETRGSNAKTPQWVFEGISEDSQVSGSLEMLETIDCTLEAICHWSITIGVERIVVERRDALTDISGTLIHGNGVGGMVMLRHPERVFHQETFDRVNEMTILASLRVGLRERSRPHWFPNGPRCSTMTHAMMRYWRDRRDLWQARIIKKLMIKSWDMSLEKRVRGSCLKFERTAVNCWWLVPPKSVTNRLTTDF